MKDKYILRVQGIDFLVYLERNYAHELCERGIDLHEIFYGVPGAIQDLGLSRPWVFMARLFTFTNPFKEI